MFGIFFGHYWWIYIHLWFYVIFHNHISDLIFVNKYCFLFSVKSLVNNKGWKGKRTEKIYSFCMHMHIRDCNYGEDSLLVNPSSQKTLSLFNVVCQFLEMCIFLLLHNHVLLLYPQFKYVSWSQFYIKSSTS